MSFSALSLSRPFVTLCIAVFATLFALAARNVLQPIDFPIYDVGFSQRAAKRPPDIIILGIDERFMAGRHPYLAPRDRLARLIEIVASGHPRAVAVDVSLDSRIDFTPNGVDETLRKALLRAKKAGIPVIVSDIPPRETGFMAQSKSDSQSLNAHGSTLPFFKAVVGSVGNVFFAPDDDGTVRNYPLEPRGIPSLALQMARLSDPKARASSLNSLPDTPLDFCGPPGTIDTQSAFDWLNNPMMAPILGGQLVFIGATFPALGDYLRTPFSVKPGVHPMYGVELLAQATDSMRREAPRQSHRTGRALFLDFFLVFGAALLAAWCATKNTAAGVASALVIGFLAAICALLSARDASWWWGFRFHPATPFWLALFLSVAAGTAWRSLIQARELKLVRDTFGAYVGSEVLASLGGKMPELGGETRPIAVLFCDIRGYSALAESMANDPRALLDELNAHFTPLVGALKRRGAYVDNYVGDLVMALFGAPVSSGSFETDVRSAVLAALDFVSLVEARNATRRAAGQMAIEIGIGVHCGLAVVGNMGTEPGKGGKIHYTAIGDVVNVASRVESATRGQNVALLLTREVVEICGVESGDGETLSHENQLPEWVFVASVPVKGRAAPVDIFKIAETPNVAELQENRVSAS